jgi:hypothetical protein
MRILLVHFISQTNHEFQRVRNFIYAIIIGFFEEYNVKQFENVNSLNQYLVLKLTLSVRM